MGHDAGAVDSCSTPAFPRSTHAVLAYPGEYSRLTTSGHIGALS